MGNTSDRIHGRSGANDPTLRGGSHGEGTSSRSSSAAAQNADGWLPPVRPSGGGVQDVEFDESADFEGDLDDDQGLFDTGGSDPELDVLLERSTLTNVSASVSALSAFQRRADRFPPLNNEQQLELARVYRAALVAQEALDSGKLKGKERAAAAEAAARGPAAMEHLCASCWRLAWLLVREQAEKRFGRDRAADMLPDLMAEANSALVRAVRDFDPRQTPKFHTYAARVIRDHLRAVLAREGYMRLAPSWIRVKRMAVTLIPELTTKLSRNPTSEELQEALMLRCLDWADAHLTDAQRALPEAQRHEARMSKLRKQGMLGAVRDIEEVLVASQPVSSLDAPVGSEPGAATLADLIPGASSDSAFDQVEHAELQSTLLAALAALSERERDILMLRHGYDGGEEWTYGRIAERHGVTSERIRQIEKAALAKLSSPHGQFAALATFRPSSNA